MAIDLKTFFKFGHSAETSGDVMASPGAGPTDPSREPLLRGLAIALAVGLLLTILSAYVLVHNREAADGYATITTRLQLLAQQAPRAVTRSLRGETEGLAELAEADRRINELVGILKQGGNSENVFVPATSDVSKPALADLVEAWKPQHALIQKMTSQAKSLAALGRLVETTVKAGPALSAAVESAGGRLPVYVERLVRGAAQLALTPQYGEAAYAQFRRDLALARELAPAGSALAKTLGELDELAAVLPAEPKSLLEALQAGFTLQKDLPRLSSMSADLALSYEREYNRSGLASFEEGGGGSGLAGLGLPSFGSLTLVAIVLLVFYANADATRRRLEAEEQRRRAEAEREMAQNAILRLLNEMSDLADGDLTVRTTVTEDITGAIADSVNFAIEELATLVRRLNDAAERVTHTTDQAQGISRRLLQAAEAQAKEIRETSAAVLATVDSMKAVSVSAQDSAEVAQVSLETAQKGATAVADSISGMNEIRGQIQETAKRIKRLGESSQEIGEIVELISDITEQTNVLALNAAIQAASAGEAGRGFSVVAEEVQRLAERSAEATKQIAALVKTIQTDTHDAVAAMEQSTQGVVEGARLSDAAGQSLAEISSVSQDLAERVTAIASATQIQAERATAVAAAMKDILEITDQTTAGTQQTTRSVTELSELAVELKGSVAGFKV
ncbi:MAG: chemotaxis protein [Betaproteobacteria bacterium HGW-Betaproteobacteria-11]|nr:MAG: chemotaxis protein [Betaproteobacteria bacterium HGW-Betaproteobacteria-11]